MPAPVLLERDAQIAALRAHLDAAGSGAGRLVFVGGEAGVGKSTLVRRFVEGSARGILVGIGGCDAMRAPRPLGPLVDLAPHLGPPLLDALVDGIPRARAFDHFLAALRQRPTVAVFEDVHWADDATLDLLRFLGRRVGGTRGLVVATYRNDEVGARHPLRAVLGDLATAPDVVRLAVPPLTLGAVATLAAGLDVDAEALYRLTGGNAFFVTELVAAGGGPLPASVRDAVVARLARLTDDARAVLETAAVVGRDVTPELLTRLGASDTAVDAGLELGLLVEVDGRIGFRHELARVAVLESVAAGRRRALHRAVLAALEATPEARADVATLAHHAAEARDPAAVLRWAPTAGRRAAALGAHREAWAQFARALPYLDRLPDEAHTELLEAYAAASEVLDRLQEAKAAWTTASERRRAAGATERWADDLTNLARVCVSLGENAAGEAASARSIEALERLPAGPALARAYGYRASLRMLDRDPEAAIVWGQRTIALATALGDAGILARAHNTVASSLLIQGRRDYAEHFQHAIDIARTHELHAQHANAHANRGSGAGEFHRFEEAERHLRAALQVAERHDLPSQEVYALAWLGLTLVHRGDWDAAASTIDRTLQRGSTTTIARIMALVALGRLRTRRGDPEVWDPLDEALALAIRTDTLQRLAPVRAARAEAAWSAGDPDRVREEADAAYPLALRARHPWFVGELGYWRWKAGAREPLPPFAAEPYALQVQGQAAPAAAAWIALGCPFEAARAAAESAAERDVRSAVAAFERLGARSQARRARERLHDLGAKGVPRVPRARTREHPAGLTPREAQVLAGLVAGWANAEIAARHGVSERTVEHQVAAVLAKLGVDRRAAAIAEAHRRGLVSPT